MGAWQGTSVSIVRHQMREKVAPVWFFRRPLAAVARWSPHGAGFFRGFWGGGWRCSGVRQ